MTVRRTVGAGAAAADSPGSLGLAAHWHWQPLPAPAGARRPAGLPQLAAEWPALSPWLARVFNSTDSESAPPGPGWRRIHSPGRPLHPTPA